MEATTLSTVRAQGARSKIAVLSDTHVDSLEAVPKRILDELTGVDLIIHAGDYTGPGVVEGLQALENFRGVYGNLDPFDVRQRLPDSLILEVNRIRIGVAHPAEGGSPFGIENRVKEKLGDVQVIIFGHTHIPKSEKKAGVLYLNPGSATGKGAIHKTYAILTLGDEVEASIFRV